MPGRDPKSEITSSVVFGIVWTALFNVINFFPKYNGILSVLKSTRPDTENYYQWWSYVAMNANGEFMPPFMDLIHMTMNGLLGYAIYRIFRAFYEMGYFRRFTNSIYVMKRLDEKTPILKRCWTVALIGIGAALFTALLLTGIEYLIYISCTPEEFMLPKGAVYTYPTF